MRHIDYGIGVLSAAVFDDWPDDRPFDLADEKAPCALGQLPCVVRPPIVFGPI